MREEQGRVTGHWTLPAEARLACPSRTQGPLGPSRPAAGVDEGPGPGRGLPRRNLAPHAPVRAPTQPRPCPARPPSRQAVLQEGWHVRVDVQVTSSLCDWALSGAG